MSDIDWERLVKAALKVQKKAYAPYSKYRVGAALMCSSGRIFIGCNVENASYPVCFCAEQVALGSAVTAGCRDFKAIVVATPGEVPAPPCGMCRQALSEFAPELPVLLVTTAGKRVKWKLSQLLPGAFQKDILEQGQDG